MHVFVNCFISFMFLKLKAQPIEGTSVRENSPIIAYSTCRKVRDILQTNFMEKRQKKQTTKALYSYPFFYKNKPLMSNIT